jgi:hypothetical protein
MYRRQRNLIVAGWVVLATTAVTTLVAGAGHRGQAAVGPRLDREAQRRDHLHRILHPT